MIEYRNARYNQSGTVDLEINHPDYGWIPFTASPDDPDQFGRDVFAGLDPANIAPYVAPPADIGAQIIAAPADLTGGPTLGEIYGNV
jgi:hypothetical protein